MVFAGCWLLPAACNGSENLVPKPNSLSGITQKHTNVRATNTLRWNFACRLCLRVREIDLRAFAFQLSARPIRRRTTTTTRTTTTVAHVGRYDSPVPVGYRTANVRVDRFRYCSSCGNWAGTFEIIHCSPCVRLFRMHDSSDCMQPSGIRFIWIWSCGYALDGWLVLNFQLWNVLVLGNIMRQTQSFPTNPWISPKLSPWFYQRPATMSPC